ncbi:cytochrome b561 and DOMON domain-containing protein At3g07570-like isoform X2 [Diospyros lotus]|uniref:cytochrome b561 and DOMON domain-containing protein At3g07570-like isoform X2 n=1 Tax=Diospyros lotus TaxID=55363 RepID=UPI0022593E2C|nr:cytochrome b561 and DOMON domain-containing protein At3g07570-like isoform X2 [Diospyros lotus]
MKKAYLIRVINVIFFIITALPAHHVSSQSDQSCASIDLNLNSELFPFDTTSLSCQPVWNPHGFILRYGQAGPSTWSFVLSAPDTNSYIAIGFSSNGRMVGSSSVVGWAAGGGAAQAKRYYLGGQTPLMVVPDQGNLFVVANSSTVISTSSGIYLAFQLITERPNSHLLYAVGPAGFWPAGPTFQLSQHRDMISTYFNYGTGEAESEGWPYSTLRTWHGILSMVGWGILIPIGVIIARYLRNWDPWWFTSHVLVQSLGLLIGAVGVICGLVLENKSMVDVTKHKIIGISILVLGCLQAWNPFQGQEVLELVPSQCGQGYSNSCCGQRVLRD